MSEKNDQSWFAVTVRVKPEAVEAIEFAFNELGALGTAIDHLRRSSSETVAVDGFFNELPDDGGMNSVFADALRIHGRLPDSVVGISIATVEQTDWLAEWKKHWRPTVIGSFVIAPPWEEFDETGKIVIRIEPSMAFGTGTHETTQLCVAFIEEFYGTEQSFLDVGTGTGILAIAAAKLGGTTIEGYDTDVDSIAIAKENAVANGCDAIRFFDGTIEAATPKFDLTCANLTIDVILPILAMLIDKTRETLILSGILAEQEEMITAALAGRSFEITRKGEWIAVAIQLA